MLGLAAGLLAVAVIFSSVVAVDTRFGLFAAGVPLAAAALVHPRWQDRVLAGLLGVLLLPVLLLIGLCIRLTSDGPVLVREPLGGGEDREVTVLRFRTAPAVGTASGTPLGERLTPVGRMLRAFRLDELPRLLDVARGRTPLRRVGPPSRRGAGG